MREPIGKGGVDVWVCAECRTERPVTARGPERPYEREMPRPTRGDAKRARVPPPSKLVKSMGKGQGNSPSIAYGSGMISAFMPTARARRKDARLFRLPARISPTGRFYTAREILEQAKQQPWWGKAEYLARDSRYYVFQETA